MSLSNQNSILAHRSIYGNQSQSSSSLTEYKTVSLKKNPPTPRRIKNRNPSNGITQFNEKARLLLEISMLKDEISQLNHILDEKKKGFSSMELATIFYLNKGTKQEDSVNSMYQESTTLDQQIEDLSGIFNSDSISRLNESNENNKALLHDEQEKYENQKEEIQAIRDRIKKIRDFDINCEILNQRNKISEKHKQIHKAVEIHRKLKEKLRKYEKSDSTKIKELENALKEAQENKKRIIKKYKIVRKQQQKERIEIEAEKLRRNKKFVISSVNQSFEFYENENGQEDSIQKSIVSFERLSNVTEEETKCNSNSILNQSESKNYIQENDILPDSDFEIATQLLSENEDEENNANKLLIEEEEEVDDNDIIINSNKLLTNKSNGEKHKKKNQKKINKEKTINEFKNSESEEVLESEVKHIKVELVSNSIQCDLNIVKDDKKENIAEHNNSEQESNLMVQTKNEIPLFLFPPESEIESTSIVYSESDFSLSQIENLRKERKQQIKELNKIENSQINSEIELKENKSKESINNDSLISNSSSENIKSSFQSESTSICNSSIDSCSFSEKINHDSITYESTSIVTSANDFKFTDMESSSINKGNKLNLVNKGNRIDSMPFNNANIIQDNIKNNSRKDKEIMVVSEYDELTSGETVILETSKPITFESPELSSQPQISTESEHTEYTEYLSSQNSENEPNFDIESPKKKEQASVSNSLISDLYQNDSSSRNIKSTSIITSISQIENNNPLNNQKDNLIKLQNGIDQNFSDVSSISSSNEKVTKRNIKEIIIHSNESSSLIPNKRTHHNDNDNYSSSCQSTALMSASDNLEDNFNMKETVFNKIEQKNHESAASLLSNRREKKESDQSGQHKYEYFGNYADEDDDDILDNKFVAEDDRKILKVGSFTIKPSKKQIMPFFVQFGTVNSYVSQHDESKYFIYIGFKKHSAAKNAKKSLNGSKIAGTRLKIQWESDIINEHRYSKSKFNFKCSKNSQNSKHKETTIYRDFINSNSSS